MFILIEFKVHYIYVIYLSICKMEVCGNCHRIGVAFTDIHPCCIYFIHQPLTPKLENLCNVCIRYVSTTDVVAHVHPCHPNY